MRRLFLLPTLAFVIAGCGANFDDDYNLIDGLRLLAVKAAPPQAKAGDKVILTSLAVDPAGGLDMNGIDINWAACVQAPIPGTGTINSDCLGPDTASYLIPLDEGADISMTMPAVDASVLLPPDATGGVYLPIRLRMAAGGVSLDGIYRLRVTTGAVPDQAPNQNPALQDVDVVTEGADGGVVSMNALSATAPMVVHSGQSVTLRASFVAGSDETYQAPNAQGTGFAAVTETLSVSWFTTAGHFDNGSTGANADTHLSLGAPLPATGGIIDLYVVGRDERGGSDFVHRQLQLE